MHALPRIDAVGHISAELHLAHRAVKVVVTVGVHIDLSRHGFSKFNTGTGRRPVVFFTEHQDQRSGGLVARLQRSAAARVKSHGDGGAHVHAAHVSTRAVGG